MLFPFEYPQLVLNMCYLFYRLKYCISIFLSFFGPFYGFKGWESNPGPLQSLGTWGACSTNRAKRCPKVVHFLINLIDHRFWFIFKKLIPVIGKMLNVGSRNPPGWLYFYLYFWYSSTFIARELLTNMLVHIQSNIQVLLQWVTFTFISYILTWHLCFCSRITFGYFLTTLCHKKVTYTCKFLQVVTQSPS